MSKPTSKMKAPIPSAPTPSSTRAIVTQLSITDMDKFLMRAVIQLLIEKDPEKIAAFKKTIFDLITEKKANLFTRYGDKTLFDALMGYYQSTKTTDPLSQVLTYHLYYKQLVQFISELVRIRQPHQTTLETRFLYPSTSSAAHERNLVEVVLTCDSIDEATLMAHMIDSALQAKYGIPLRSSTKYLQISFQNSDIAPNKVKVCMRFRPEDYVKLAEAGASPESLDKALLSVFKNPKQNLYEYCHQKYGIAHNTQAIRLPVNPAPDTVNYMDISATAIRSPAPPNTESLAPKLLVITRTYLGLGNYTNARLAIEGITQHIPQAQIHWILANDGDILPATNALPPQVTLYEVDTLWKLYPLIRSLSLDVDVVLCLPNNFLKYAEYELLYMPLVLSPHCISMEVAEYNHVESMDDLPPRCVKLNSGINAPLPSLGLLKPQPLALPDTLDEKRALLSQHPKGAEIFRLNPSAPLYFAYGFQELKAETVAKITGLKLRDTISLFIQHAKLCKHKSIKTVLPISQEALLEAITLYPHIFSNCTLQFCDKKTTRMTLHEDGSDPSSAITIEVFNLFPFDNATFRSLMDYAVACHTPVVTTGDQSLFELFFTTTQGFTFIYQLLESKKPLFDQLKAIMRTENMPSTLKLMTLTEKGIHSEKELITVTEFIVSHEASLKKESLALMAVIRAQPELSESLSKVLVECVMQKASHPELTPSDSPSFQ